MRNSLLIGRLAGIRIFLHWAFLLLGFLVFAEVRRGSSSGAVLVSVGFVLALFAGLALHELGPSLAARRFGIGTRSIALLPIGGRATLERMPEKPRQELPVLDPAGQVVGVLSRPLLMAALRDYRLTTAVGEGMSRAFDTVEIGESLAQVYARALRKPNAFFSVLDNHRRRGIIDQTGLTEFLTIRAALSR